MRHLVLCCCGLVLAGAARVGLTAPLALHSLAPEKVTFAVGPSGATLGKSIVQADGKIVVTGSRVVQQYDGRSRIELFVRRFEANGSTDTAFGTAGETRFTVLGSDAIQQVAQQPDGKLVMSVFAAEPCTAVSIGVCLTDSGSQVKLGSALLRFNADGKLDPAFGGTGAVVTTEFYGGYALALLPDGKLLLLGSTSIARARIYDWKLARFNGDGTRDTTFNNGAAVASRCPAFGFSMVVQPDGAIVVAGDDGAFYADSSLNPGFCIERRHPDGTPDLTFNPALQWTAFGINVTLGSIALLPGGKLLVVGRGVESNFPDPNRAGVIGARYLSDGSLDPAYGDGGKWFVPAAESFAYTGFSFAQDGGIVAAGYDYTALPPGQPQQYRTVIVKVLANGQRDPGLGNNGVFALNLGDEVLAAFVRDIEDRWVLISTKSLADGSVNGIIEWIPAEVPNAVEVVEFFNTGLGHYFLTASAAEAAGIDAGAAGPGWQRTSHRFFAWQPVAAGSLVGVPTSARPLCRFYGTPGMGPNSHFYTIDDAECALVKTDPGWMFENLAFYAYRLVATANGPGCPAGLVPVYRAYNNRFAQNDSNHRYTTNPAVFQQMKDQGWIGEGAVFCAAPG